jgi:hypothetical protein
MQTSGGERREKAKVCPAVIASKAKQSMSPHAEIWIASSLQRKIALQFCRELLAMTWTVSRPQLPQLNGHELKQRIAEAPRLSPATPAGP